MNLVAFGCSHTQGIGLEDIYPETSKISKLAWPQKLADLIGCTVTNLGKGGASNKQILHRLLNHRFMQDDIAIVCWTHTDRWCIIRDKDIEAFGIWNYGKAKKDARFGTMSQEGINDPITSIATAFYEHIHDDEDRKQEMHRDIEFAKLYLNSKGIKNYHMTAMNLNNNNIGGYSWFNTKILDVDVQKTKDQNQLASDNHHPGTKAHQIVAEKVFKLTEGLSN